MFFRCLLGSLTLLCVLPASAQENYPERIAALFADWDGLDQPGCAVGVFHKGEILYQAGFGAANLEHQSPITPTTVFRLGSVSKQFTAAGVLLLVLDGKLQLTDTLPEFFPDAPGYAASISVAQLLHHTSGLRDYDQLVQYCAACDIDCFYEDDLRELLWRQKGLNHPPGTEYVYTNSGYWLLGQIIEIVSGQSLAEFAHERLFAPLGMTQTQYFDDYTQVIPERAYGYGEDEEAPTGHWWYNTTNSIVGDGGVLSSIVDLKKWDDEYYQRRILKDTFWSLALQVGYLENGVSTGYAAGLEVKAFRGTSVHSHNGNAFGFCATFERAPESELTVVILSNREEAYAIADYSREILGMFLPEPDAEVVTIPQYTPLAPEVLDTYVGDYWNGQRFASRTIYVEEDTLYYGRRPGAGFPIFAIAKDHFHAENGLAFVFSAETDNPKKLQLFRAGKLVSTYQQFQAISTEGVNLDMYTGNYWSEELETAYELRLEADQLIWYSEGEAVTRLNPVMEDVLQTPGGSTFHFQRTAGGNVGALTVSNYRMRGVSFLKK